MFQKVVRWVQLQRMGARVDSLMWQKIDCSTADDRFVELESEDKSPKVECLRCALQTPAR